MLLTQLEEHCPLGSCRVESEQAEILKSPEKVRIIGRKNKPSVRCFDGI